MMLPTVPGEVEKLEREFAGWQGAAGAVAAGFGRSALLLALAAAGVRGAEVAVPDFICTQVTRAVRQAGAQPVFYRVGTNLHVTPEHFTVSLTPRTRAAIVAHYYGHAQPDISTLAEVCRVSGVTLVEDCALALGARSQAALAGSFGRLAVFSFTKSNWCFGGGLVTSRSAASLEALQRLRAEKLRDDRKLALCYGVLRRADFAANRPICSRLAAMTGRWLERLSGVGDGNFYDAGRFDAAMPPFTAARARRILAGVDEETALRQRVVRGLLSALGEGAKVCFLRDRDGVAEGSNTAAFLLIRSPSGRAAGWVELASRNGVTLRRCWPAYQTTEAAQTSESLSWLAEHLLILEVHPRLRAREVERIAQVLRRLGAES